MLHTSKPITVQSQLEGEQIEHDATSDGLLSQPERSPQRSQWVEEIKAHLSNHTPSDDPARLQEWLEERQ